MLKALIIAIVSSTIKNIALHIYMIRPSMALYKQQQLLHVPEVNSSGTSEELPRERLAYTSLESKQLSRPLTAVNNEQNKSHSTHLDMSVGNEVIVKNFALSRVLFFLSVFL